MKIEILNDKGMPIELVRYFLIDGKPFFIFTEDNTTDNEGHITIHVSSIRNGGNISADTVADDDWDLVKNTIKNIVNSNKNNQALSIEDLDYNKLDGIAIVDSRALKLMETYVNLLKANQPIFEKQIVENLVKPVSVDNNFDNLNVSSVDSYNAGLEVPSMAQNIQTIEQNLQSNLDIPQNVSSSVSENIANNVDSADSALTSINTVTNNENQLDYKTLYFEQLELVNQLRSEISNYSNKLETLKNIING